VLLILKFSGATVIPSDMTRCNKPLTKNRRLFRLAGNVTWLGKLDGSYKSKYVLICTQRKLKQVFLS
jgi:hypothetical protein